MMMFAGFLPRPRWDSLRDNLQRARCPQLPPEAPAELIMWTSVSLPSAWPWHPGAAWGRPTSGLSSDLHLRLSNACVPVLGSLAALPSFLTCPPRTSSRGTRRTPHRAPAAKATPQPLHTALRPPTGAGRVPRAASSRLQLSRQLSVLGKLACSLPLAFPPAWLQPAGQAAAIGALTRSQ